MRDRTVTVGAPSLEQRMIAWRVGSSQVKLDTAPSAVAAAKAAGIVVPIGKARVCGEK